MNKKYKLVLFLGSFSFLFFFTLGTLFSAEFRTESNKVITNVGNAPVDTTALSGAFSCPLKGTRTIGCGSVMSDPKFNRNACAGPQPIDRGHCGNTYGYCRGGINARRAHAIDVDGTAGEPVYLPTINGQIVEWKYGTALGRISDKDGGGYGHTFTSHVGNDNWILYLIHVNSSVLGPADGTTYKSGDNVTQIDSTCFAPKCYPHVHINIGKNPTSLDFGPGWHSPEDLGMCVN